jgi:predicted RNase H-like HicB family nuclease
MIKKTMLRYEIILILERRRPSIYCRSAELPGCAADGETYKEALQNVEIIMQ